MENKTLYDILKSKSENLTSQEIQNILDEELEKSPNEMDTDLVDLCLNALENVATPQQNNGKKKIKLSKILIAVAIFALVVAMAVPVCAKYLNISINDIGFVQRKDDFKVDMTDNKNIDDIKCDLKQDEIVNPMLPSAFNKENATFYNYYTDEQEGIETVAFDLKYNDFEGNCIITKYDSEHLAMLGDFEITDAFDDFEELTVDGNSVLVYSNNKTACIYYLKGATEYLISMDCDHNTACEIAKTL